MVAILHNIRSLHNVGSIFRTADAAGIEKLYLCGITPSPLDRFGKVRPQVAKVALGAERLVKWEKRPASAQASADAKALADRSAGRHATSKVISELKKEGYKIIAVEQSRKSIPYYKLRLTDSPVNRLSKLAFVLGNEVRGLPATILAKADTIVEIPMRGAMVRQAHHPRNQGRKMVRQAHHKESLNVAVAFGIVAFHIIHSSFPRLPAGRQARES